MAASKPDTDSVSNIPEYEYGNANTTTIHIDSFRKEWLKRLQPSEYSYTAEDEDTFHANFAHETGISVDTMRELQKVCRERKKKQDYKSTLKISKNRHELYADEQERLATTMNPEAAENRVPEGDVILTVNVYYPATFEKFCYVRPHVTLLLLGSQKLTELRDAICCASDLQVYGEFSNNPDVAPDFVSKDHYKSAFFFLEGVFYNDMRYPECRDISQTTITWAKANKFPSYTQANMEDTTLVDLKVKVGFPYLYCHQGDCEHVVIITDVRLTHKDDCLDRTLYPMLIHKHRIATQKCAVCYTFIARWCTVGDQFAPSHPCLFCDKCFRKLHYDADGNKLGEFLAYPYVDRGAFN
ncbi:snRNA-activating protein complex subunit 3 isoform X2 [Corythoichthys intestinalis]|uniref:snRNA-activating protein complex subunit 3 isoform X2 n=1 Tax=Corythoichthys intestinalis TaxID=161448 RepID=UPI0025A5037B|nr:snRNA-activating protein complex subunit 3 isoform X2 [Corythoichthys intestinalis]